MEVTCPLHDGVCWVFGSMFLCVWTSDGLMMSLVHMACWIVMHVFFVFFVADVVTCGLDWRSIGMYLVD